MTRPLCIYHSPCADGFTSAWVVNRFFKGEVDFHPGVYGNPPPNMAGRDVILVDFSYKRPVLEALLRSNDVGQARTILVLDHHKTALEDLAGIKKPEAGNYDPDQWRVDWEQFAEWPVRCQFDMERSGAQMTWDFFYPDTPRPTLVNYVGDRDLWQFKLTTSREVNAYIFAHDYIFSEWDKLEQAMSDGEGRIACAKMGAAIEKKHHKDIRELLTVTARTMIIGGVEVPVANLPYTMTSDAGHYMAVGQPFAACYWDTPTARVFSLRSTDAGYDVSVIAATYGGGGHRNAAGFQMPIGWEGDE